MASPAPVSTGHRTQVQYSPWPSKPPNVARAPKPHKNLHFLSKQTLHPLSNSSSSSFPSSLNPKFPRNPLLFNPLNDSSHDHLLEDLEKSIKDRQALENLMGFDASSNQSHQIVGKESERRVFIQDPPWISALFLKGLQKLVHLEVKVAFKDIEKRKYNLLRRRQIKEETEAWERMAEEYKGLVREMCEKKLAPNLPYVKGLLLGWFEPLKEAIEKEQNLQRSKKQKAAFAPHIESLPADKMALIVMHKMMGLLMVGHDNGCVQVVQAAVQIGIAIEQEV